MLKTPISLYVHWPYCSFLCKFCAFSKTRIPQNGIDHESIVGALLTELHTSLLPFRHGSKELHSIYFGGGTPSLAQPQHIERIIREADRLVPLAHNAEITLESNPTLAEMDKMRDFKQAGVNRYSIGVQTLNDATLSKMGRLHTGAEGLAAVDRARHLFPGKVSFDMIFGFENQTLDTWQQELETALKHVDGHLSVYQLAVEPGTPLFRDQRAQRIQLPEGDVQAQMYEMAVDTCKKHGLYHYEVSSYAASSKSESMHNKAYWRAQEWVGIGPSAWSRFVDTTISKMVRIRRIPDTSRWVKQCQQLGHGTATTAVVSEREAMQEAVVFGLRMMEGISDQQFRQSTQSSQHLTDFLDMDHVEQYVHSGHLVWDPLRQHLRPTEKGLQVIDSILLDVIA